MLTAVDTSSRQLGPVRVRARSRAAATGEIVRAVQRKETLRVAFANTHLLYYAVRDPRFAEMLNAFYVVNDGIGVSLLARMTCGRGFEENLNGTDFTPHLLAALPAGTRILLVGGRTDVVQRAASQIMETCPHLIVCGSRDGFGGSERALLEMPTLAPDVVLAAMGNPKQERWIERAAKIRPHTVFVGVGALFDFLAGAVPRAPKAWRQLRMEWVFRLLHDPGRLWQRYTVEVLVVTAALARASRRRAA